MILHGERVCLRPFRPEEFEVVWEARLRSTAAAGPPDREGLRTRHAHSGDWHEDRLDLAVEAGGALVGEIDVRRGRRMLPEGVCELGIELWEDRRGAGRGTEAIGLVTAWLHEHGFPRVQAGTDLRNAPMRRVFEKLGWEAEGVLRSFMPDGAGRADFVLYAHLA